MSEITLPIKLTTCELTLQEIGAIVVMFSFPKTTGTQRAKWAKSTEFSDACVSLIDRNVVSITKDDSFDIEVYINLDALADPDDDPFWGVWDYDEDDNEILSHPSHYGDEGSRFEYLLYQSLKSNKIVFTLNHSEYGLIEDYIESVEEAEFLVREKLAEELGQIKREDLNKSDGGKRR